MPLQKTDRKSGVGKLPEFASSTGSLYSITNLEDGLPLVRHRRQGSPFVLPCLTVGAGICVVALATTVIYLVVGNSIVQRQLKAARVQLDSINERLDWLAREHPELYSHGSHEKTLEDVQSSKLPSNSLTDMEQQNSSVDQSLENEVHVLQKRDVSKTDKTDTKSSRSRKNSERNLSGESDRSHSLESKRARREKRELNKRLGDVIKDLQSLKMSYSHDMSNLAHPSARMILPNKSDDITMQHYSPVTDNAITWKVEHNALFETDDSAHFTVKTPGAYFVYLQVTYNGQERRVNPTCSHIVVAVNPKYNRTRLLLYGSTTQYNLGGLIRVPVTGEEIKAIDSVHVSGVFHLMPEDRLYVKPDEFSYKCIVSDFKDKTFFGAFRLQSSFQQIP